MKRMVVAAFAAAVMGVGALMGTLGAGEASAACTTFDEHNKVVMRDCPSGSAGSSQSAPGAGTPRPESYTLTDRDGNEHTFTRWTTQ